MPSTPSSVFLVSTNPETLDGTHKYLSRAGAYPRSVQMLDAAQSAATERDVIVFFADDYPRAHSVSVVTRLRRTLRAALLVVVTEDIEIFSTPSMPAQGRKRIVVLQRPVWGWTLIDVLRAGASWTLEGTRA